MNYTHKQLIEALRTRAGKPMMVRELMRLLRLKADDRHDLKHVLNQLVQSGEIVKTRGNRFGLPDKMDLEAGFFQAHPSGVWLRDPGKEGQVRHFHLAQKQARRDGRRQGPGPGNAGRRKEKDGGEA